MDVSIILISFNHDYFLTVSQHHSHDHHHHWAVTVTVTVIIINIPAYMKIQSHDKFQTLKLV